MFSDLNFKCSFMVEISVEVFFISIVSLCVIVLFVCVVKFALCYRFVINLQLNSYILRLGSFLLVSVMLLRIWSLKLEQCEQS